jgi:hypothetical protein
MLGYSSFTRDRIIDGFVVLCWGCYKAEMQADPSGLTIQVLGADREEYERLIEQQRRAN